ncbi:MAG: beta-lactamase domain protein [Solirubrobacterales bacterium]|nr:beta-lactamase domain protein [Solirubrobacterales bacterium]
MRLHVLSLGASEVDKGVMLTPGIDLGEWVMTPVPAYLVETDDGERVLIDTGLHPDHIADPGMTWRDVPMMASAMREAMAPEHRIEHQLGLLDLTVDDVTHVVSSHLHYDHCGQHFHFKGQPILVSGAHLAAARADPAFFPPRYFELPELNWVDTDGQTELFKGISVIETPGHAPHHRSFLIDLPESGPVILAIDAILSKHQVDTDSWVGQPDVETARASGRHLLSVAAARGASILFGHDPEQWVQIRRAPDFYD